MKEDSSTTRSLTIRSPYPQPEPSVLFGINGQDKITHDTDLEHLYFPMLEFGSNHLLPAGKGWYNQPYTRTIRGDGRFTSILEYDRKRVRARSLSVPSTLVGRMHGKVWDLDRNTGALVDKLETGERESRLLSENMKRIGDTLDQSGRYLFENVEDEILWHEQFFNYDTLNTPMKTAWMAPATLAVQLSDWIHFYRLEAEQWRKLTSIREESFADTGYYFDLYPLSDHQLMISSRKGHWIFDLEKHLADQGT
jgi:hypothetical protein